MALKHIGASYSKKDLQEYITTAKTVTKQANLPQKATTNQPVVKPSNAAKIYTPSIGLTEEQYNQKRQIVTSLPEFGSYQYLLNREKEIGAELDKIISKTVNPRNAQRYAGSSLYGGPGEVDKEYADKVAQEYENIVNALSKFTKGVNYDKNGNIDVDGGIKENQAIASMYGKVDTYYMWAGKDNPYAARGYVTQEYRVKSTDAKNAGKLSTDKADAYKYYEKHSENTYNDGITGIAAGNYRVGDIDERIGKAGNIAYNNKTDDLEAVEIYQLLQKKLIGNNQATFDSDDYTGFQKGVATFANYAPQFINQSKAQIGGAVVGGLIGYAMGNPVMGARLGSSIFSADYMFKQTAGAKYVELLQNSELSIEDAKALATNTAIASSVVEFGLDFALSGLFKGGKYAKNLVTSTAKELTEEAVGQTGKKITEKIVGKLVGAGVSKKGAEIATKVAIGAGKTVLNSFGEGVEEWIQQGMEFTANRYAQKGQTASTWKIFTEAFDFSQYTDEEIDQMDESFKAGMIIGIGSAGVHSAAYSTINKVLKSVGDAQLGTQVKDLRGATVPIDRAIEYGINSEDKAVQKIATRVYEQSENGIENISNKDLGALIRNAFENKYNVFTGTEIVEEAPEPKKTFGEKVKGAVDVVKDAFGTNNEQTINAPRIPSTEVSTIKAPKVEETQLKAPVSTEVSINAPVKTADVQSAIERITSGTATNKDYDLFKPANAKNRQMFEDVTGVKLPATNSDTRKYLRSYVSNQNIAYANNDTVTPSLENTTDTQDMSSVLGLSNGQLRTDFETEDPKLTNIVDLSDDNDLVSRISGLRGSSKYKEIRNYILEKLSDSPIIFKDGTRAIVDKSDALHIANKSANKKVAYISKITELIKSADLYAVDKEVEHNKFNEFRYYQVGVRLGNDTYPIYLNVGKSKNGDGYHLYDITKKVGKVAKQNNALERVNNDLRSEIDIPTNNNIPQNGNTVNSQYMQYDLNNATESDIINVNGGVRSERRDDGNSSGRARSEVESAGKQSTSVSSWRQLGNRRINELIRIFDEVRPQNKEAVGRAGEKVNWTSVENNGPKTDAEIFVENEAQRFGLEVEYATDITVTSKDGKVTNPVAFARGNKIVLSDRATFKDVVHEIVHHIRRTNTRKYNAIKAYVTENMDASIYNAVLETYIYKYSQVYGFGDLNSMNETDRAKVMDIIEEEMVCDIAAQNKIGNGVPLANQEEFTQLVEELFDTEKKTISYTPSNNQASVKSSKSPVADFMKKLDFLPLPKTKNGNVKRNITQATATELIEIINDYARTGQIDQNKAQALFDTLYNSSVVESVENFDEAVNYIKGTKLYISSEDKGTIPDFNKFRQSMFKKLDITTDKSKGGLSTDVFFEEFTSLFPGMVDESLTHPADQLQALANFVTDAKSKQTQTLDDYFGEGAESAKEQMHEMFTEELDAFVKGEEIKYSAGDIENDATESLDDEILDLLPVKKVKMKNFPSYKVSQSDAHEVATRWAYREDVQSGAQRIAFYHNKCYLIEKFEGLDFGYQISGTIRYSDYQRIVKGVKENGINKNEQPTVQEIIDVSKRNKQGSSAERRKHGVDGDAIEHRRESGTVYNVVGNQNGGRQITDYGKRNNESNGEDREIDSSLDFRYSTGTTEKTADYYNQRYAELLEEYGAIKKGAQPRVEESETPKRSSQNKYVSQYARTMAESGLMKGEMEDEFKKMVVEGKMSHEVFTDKMAEKGAEARVKFNGFDESVEEFKGKVKSGGMNKEDIALGQMLFNLACQNKDTKLAMELAIDLSLAATQFGQNVQAFYFIPKNPLLYDTLLQYC